MIVANIYDAKTQLSRLIDAARRGEDVVIARDGKPMVRLVAVEAPDVARRRPGSGKAQIRIADDFNEPVPGQSDYEP